MRTPCRTEPHHHCQRQYRSPSRPIQVQQRHHSRKSLWRWHACSDAWQRKRPCSQASAIRSVKSTRMGVTHASLSPTANHHANEAATCTGPARVPHPARGRPSLPREPAHGAPLYCRRAPSRSSHRTQGPGRRSRPGHVLRGLPAWCDRRRQKMTVHAKKKQDQLLHYYSTVGSIGLPVLMLS